MQKHQQVHITTVLSNVSIRNRSKTETEQKTKPQNKQRDDQLIF